MDYQINRKNKFYDILIALKKESSYLDVQYPQNYDDVFIQSDVPILIIGAGGLGCQILKNLALSSFKNLHIIDVDTIQLTNLNRQFLFRQSDIGKYKSQVAAQFIMSRVKGVVVTPYTCLIQQKQIQFYRQFKIIVCGLDNIEARRWINSVVHQIVQYDNDNQIIASSDLVLLDAGTQGLKGQARVIKPFRTACYQCTLETLPKQSKFNSCTIANTPRIPQHCIAYVYELMWDIYFPQRKMDPDNGQNIKWIYEKALQRGKEFGISGITYEMTVGVIKNIIPAVVSTNAILAGILCNQVYKIVSGCNPTLNNYFQYKGHTYVDSQTYNLVRKKDCIICSRQKIQIDVKVEQRLSDFLDKLKQYGITNPSISLGDKFIMLSVNKQEYAHNLDKHIIQLINNQNKLYVTDKSIGSILYVSLNFK